MFVLSKSAPATPSEGVQRSGVLPVDPPRAHASGSAPYRVLAIGGRLLAGRGVLTHDLSLTGSVARGISRLTGHGTDVESIVLDRTSGSAIGRAARSRDLSKIDAVILVPDPVRDHARPADAARRLNQVADELWRSMTPAASITIVLPAARPEHAVFVEGVTSGAAPLTRIVVLPDVSGVVGSAGRFAARGAAIASAVATSLVAPIVWCDPVDRLNERARSAEVRRLGTLDPDWDAFLRPIVSAVGRAYGTECAALTVIEGNHAQYLARAGFDARLVPRGETICDIAMRTYGGVIVGDARADDRFSGLPLVQAGEVGFYAGYRIDGPTGQPIGALCVFDTAPRRVRSQDIDLLRDFAIITERRIWERCATRSIA